MPLTCVLKIPTSRIGFLRKSKITEGHQYTRIIISQDINAKNPQVALSIQQSIDDIVIHITMKVAVAYSNNRRILYNTRCKNKYVFDWPQNDKCLSVASQRCLLKWKREIQNASNSILTKTTSQNQFCNNDAVEEKLDPILK